MLPSHISQVGIGVSGLSQNLSKPFGKNICHYSILYKNGRCKFSDFSHIDMDMFVDWDIPEETAEIVEGGRYHLCWDCQFLYKSDSPNLMLLNIVVMDAVHRPGEHVLHLHYLGQQQDDPQLELLTL